MDPAQEIELAAYRYQKPMNDVIDRGDSPVQQFYSGASVFVTGGSGFIGKQLIEKLFRSCAIKKMYLLSRAKKGRTMKERLQQMLSDPVYDKLREKQPTFADLIVPVEGNVADIKLGLSDKDWQMLSEEVNIIFHVAATIRFNEPLRVATLTNVRGTRETLALAKDCTNFKKLVHVSTAFTHATKDRINSDVLEQFYPSPINPNTMIELVETVEEKRLDAITANLIEGWPNTYTFTKTLAEELLKNSAGDVPVCIVRPSIVLPAYYEPGPGWTDLSAMHSPSGLVIGFGLGVMHVVKCDVNCFFAMAPVDYVNNAIIASAWDSTNIQNNNENYIPIYTIRENMRFGLISETLKKEQRRICTDYAIWYVGGIDVKNKLLYFIMALFLHYIPAYFLDLCCAIIGKKPKEIRSFVDIYKKVDKQGKVYEYFMTNVWHFKDDNLQSMISRMNIADKSIFNCDVNTIDLIEYVLVLCIGLRKYVIKDGIKNTDKGYRKNIILKFVNYFVCALYGYVLWCAADILYSFIKNIMLFISL